MTDAIQAWNCCCVTAAVSSYTEQEQKSLKRDDGLTCFRHADETGQAAVIMRWLPP